MKAIIERGNSRFEIDLAKPIDISIPLSPEGPRAWYAKPMSIVPEISPHIIGSVKLGGAVNFRNIVFNPHAHGTHTESVGHISPELNSVNKLLTHYFFEAQLISVAPQKINEDRVIVRKQIEVLLKNETEALVIRTLPNATDKLTKNFSNTNFPYFHRDALALLAEKNVQHLLVDLPSVDREEDGGKLEAHRAFWKYPSATRMHCTITEFIFVPDEVVDGNYLLNLQTAPFENDATPSRPVLFAIHNL